MHKAMTTFKRGRRIAVLLAVFAATALGSLPPPATGAGSKKPDPAQFVPLEKIPENRREEVAEVIRESTFHHVTNPDTFACNPKVYLSLLNEPSITLALWNDLWTSPARLSQIAPGMYQGVDGNGTTATWEFVHRSAQKHVLLCWIEYSSPKGRIHLNGRIVLIVHASYYKHASGELLIRHTVEAFVKIDSKGWKSIARAGKPLIEGVIRDQVQEAGLFVSLMSRLVERYPLWATGVVMAKQELTQEKRSAFRELVLKNRRADALPGRPEMMDQAAADQRERDPKRR